MADGRPILAASAGEDPEGSALSYLFELDTVATFDSADLEVADLVGGSDPVTWSLADDGIVLPAGTTWFARVQATDADGIASVPNTIRFTVAGEPEGPAAAGAGCGCESGTSGSSALLLLLPAMLLRRR